MRTTPLTSSVAAFRIARKVSLAIPLFVLTSSLSAQASIFTWAGGTTGTWTNGGSWGGTAPGGGDTASFAGTGTQTASMNGTGASVGGITVSNTGTTTIQGGTGAGSTLTLGTGGITASAGTLVVGGGTGTLTLAVSGNQNWTNNSAGTMTVGTGTATSTLTTGAAGTSTITINGTGPVVLGGNIMDGTAGNGPLALAISSGSVTLGVSGGVTSNYSGGTTLSGGALELLTADALGNGALTITGGTLDTAGAAGVITAANAVNVNGSFTFGTANKHSATFNGATTISNADTINVKNLDLSLSGTSSTTFVAGSALTVTGGGVLVFGSNNSANTWSAASTNTITITGSQLEFELANGAVVANNIVNNVTNGLLDSGTGTTTFSGAIAGTANFENLGTGESLLTGTNTYAKGTTISAGSVQFAQILSMPATGTVTVSSGATLAVNAGGSGEWANGTSGAGTIGGLFAGVGGQSGSVVTLNSGSTVGIDTTDATGVFTYSGTITNVGVGLTKLGTGTLALSGPNTFTGATTLTGGTLQYDGTSSVSSGSALVINGTGGTLGLNLLSDTSGTFSTAGISLSGSNGTLNIDADPLTSASGQTLTLTTGTITMSNNATGNVINVTSANGYNVGLGAISMPSSSNNIPASHTLQLNAGSGLNVSTGLVTYGSWGGELILGGTGTITIAQLDYNSNNASATVIGDGTPGNSPTVTFTTGPVSSGSRSSGSAAFTLNSGAFNITSSGILNDPNGSNTLVNINGGQLENMSGTAVAGAAGTGAITLGGNFSFGNSTDTAAGSLTIGLAGGTVYIKENVANLTLTLNGGGSLTLAGAFTNTTGVATNTLTVNDGSGTTSASQFALSGLNLSSGTFSGTQTINGSGNVTISSVANGGTGAGAGSGTFTTAAAGTLIYGGTGTLTLSGSSSFSGGLDVNSGTVAASAGTSAFGSSSNAINVNGGTLSIGANNETTGTVTLASGTIAGTTGTLTGTSYAMQSGTVTAILGGAGGLTKTTAGSVLLSSDSTYTGGTTISAGVVQIGIGIGSGGSSALGNTSKSLTLSTTGTLDLNGFSTTIGTLLGSGTVLNSASSTTELLTFNNSGSAGNSNTFSGVIENNAGSGGTVAVQKNGADLEIFTGNNTYTGTTTVSTGTLQIGNGSNGSIASTSTITMSGTGAAVAFDEANGTTISNTIVDTPAGDLVVGAEGAGSTNTLSGVISGGFGGGFLQSGAGTTILTNADTYTGTTTISTGTLQLGNGGATGKLATTGTIVDNGTFAIDRSNAVAQGTDFGSVAITGSGGLVQLGTGTTTLEAAETYTGTTTISAGALQLGAGGTGATLSTSSVIVDNATFIIDRSNAVTQGIDFSSTAITGTGGLVQSGTGTTTLETAEGYTGTTTISAGALRLGNGGTSAALSTSSAIVDNALLIINRSNAVRQGTDFSGAAITGSGGLTQAGTGTTTLTAANAYSGTTTIAQGAISVGTVSATNSTAQNLGEGSVVDLGSAGTSSGELIYTGGTGTLGKSIFALGNGSDTVDNAGTGTLTLSGSLVKNGTKLTLEGGINVTGTISGASSGSDLIINTGTTTLSSANTYNGPTYIRNNATLNAAVAGALPTGTRTDVTMDDIGTGTSTLALGASQSISSLTGASSSLVTLSTNTLTIGNSGTGTGTATFAGVISGTNGALTKDGTSTEILSGANTYTGATTISAGTLNITGSTYSAGAVTISSGGTLKGTGSTGLVTLNSGGSINLTDSAIGVLTIGSLTTTGGGSLTFDIGGGTTNTDKISDLGTLTASNLTTVNLNAISGSLSTGTYTILAYTGTQQALGDFQLTGGASSLSIDGKVLTLAQSGDNIEIVVANSTTSTTYTLSTSAGSTLLHSGATTTLTTVVTNTGTGISDTLNYSGLGATATNGSVTGSYTSGGPLANSSVGTGTNTQTYTAGVAGGDTISATGSGTNATIGGSATLGSSTGTTINVYTGVGVWNTNGGGSWGAVAVNPTNWTANGGTPGVTAGFANTDSASFGSILASGTGSVTLDGENPSLNAITFNDSAASYVIAQGTGTGSITLDGNGGNANVTDLAGTHTISAPINLATSANVNVASGQQLTMSGTISGIGGLVNNGSGTTILSGSNGYSGGTTVSSGILQLSNSSGSATGSGALSVGAGATLAGTGSSSGTSFSLTGSSSTRATVLVGHNTSSDLNTTGVMSLQATGASSIGSANLVFNLDANVAGQGNQLSIGATNVAFNTVGSMNTTLTLNLQGASIIATGTDYILVAGTTASGGSGQLDSQYTGLDLGTSVSLGTGITETKILNSNFGGTGSLNLSFGAANSYYGANSTLFLYQNTNTGQDDIEVEVVPEPGTWAMMLGGLAVLLFWQRRKNRS